MLPLKKGSRKEIKMDIFKTKINEIPESKFKELLILLAYRRSPDGAISRKQLAYNLELSDREVRRLITQARKSRFPIISSSHDGGYYLAQTVKEIQEFRNREIRSRIKDLKQTDDGMLGAAEDMENFNIDQITIDEVE